MPKVIIIEPIPATLLGLKEIVKEIDYSILSTFLSADNINFNSLNLTTNDIIITDIIFPPNKIRIDLITNILHYYPDIKVVVFTHCESSQAIKKCVTLGIHGYLMKWQSVEDIQSVLQSNTPSFSMQVLKAIISDSAIIAPSLMKEVIPPIPDHLLIGNKLSAREMEITHLVSSGLTNAEIANKLFISRHTVAKHKQQIAEKLSLKSVSHIAAFVARSS